MSDLMEALPVDVGVAPPDAEIVEGIHVLLTRNKTFYKEKALREALQTWVSPYPKPVIMNHDTTTEAIGRVVGAVVTKSIVKPEYTTARLYLNVGDPAAKEKLKDGRYQTFSIGSSVDSVTCSVCGKDILTEDFCGHRKGRRYDGNMCYWNIESISSFDEVSVVNVPSDPIAMRITQMVRKGEVKEGMNKAGDMEREELLRSIEAASSLLEQEGEAQPEVTPETVIESEVQPEVVPEDQVVESDNPPVTVESVQNELATAQAELVEAHTSLSVKESEMTALAEKLALVEGDLATAKAQCESLQAGVTAKDVALEETRRQNVSFARLATSAYREHAITLAIFTGQFGSREEAEARFATERIDALQSYVTETVAQAPTRPEQRIASPVTVEGNGGNEIVTNEAPETVADFQKVLQTYMQRKR